MPNGWTLDDIARICPIVELSREVRYPVLGATFQPRGGIAKHDYVAWAYARAADALGVDLIQHAEVTGFDLDGDRVTGVVTSRGRIGGGSRRHRRGGAYLDPGVDGRHPAAAPVHPLQALVSELLEPIHPTVVMSNAVHVYVSQAYKGELVIGAGLDRSTATASAASFHVIEHQMAALVELFPIFARAHVLRTWGGIVDVAPGRVADHRHDTGPRTCTSTAAGGPAGSRRRRSSGWVLAQRRDGRAARAGAAVRARAIHDGRAHRRARRGRGGPLMLLIECPWCGPRDEIEFRYGGQAQHRVPARSRRARRRRLGRLPVHARQPEGAVRRALVHTAGLPALVQRRPRHADERGPRVYPTGSAAPRHDADRA